jgi:hypothetical protein
VAELLGAVIVVGVVGVLKTLNILSPGADNPNPEI